MRLALRTSGVLLTLGLSAASQATPIPDPGVPGQRDTGLPTRFAVIGDFGTTNAQSFAVAALVRALAPRFVVTLGDNNYPSGEADTIDENIGQHYHDFIQPYVGSYGPGAFHNRFFPSLGNHDWSTDDAQPYLDYFELPGNERYYDFRRGPVHFFVLDSDNSEPDGNERDSLQAAWLATQLAASSAPFRIVTLHHAPYDSSDHHGSQGDLQWPFKEWGASLVLAGHDHLYERLSISGLPYVVNGLGGRAAYDFAAPIGGSQLRFNAEHGALLVEADEDFAHLRFVTSSGSVQDDFVLPRGGLDPGTTELVGADAEWRYLVTGVAPSPSWNRPFFDDSGWASGRAQLGYGESDEATTVGYGGDRDNRFVTTWFRRSFQLAHPREFETLQLRLLCDDGALVYLNGAEVARVRMPAGSVTPTTLASENISGNDEVTFTPFTFGTSALVELGLRQLAAGENVLAVELHQASLSSSDLSFAAELVGLQAGTMLLARGSSWRYLDAAAAPDVSWKDPGFDDGAWPSGPAQFGQGEGDEATPVSGAHTTTWFRSSFTLAEASAVRWLSCRLLRDDGAIVYLNGEEAARFDLPRTSVAASTLAAFEVAPENEDVFVPTSLDPRLLVDGLNTLAVELHGAPASNDLSFDLELVAH